MSSTRINDETRNYTPSPYHKKSPRKLKSPTRSIINNTTGQKRVTIDLYQN